MESPKINFLNTPDIKKSKKGKKILPKILFFPFVFLIVFAFVFTFQVLFLGDSFSESLEKINIFSNVSFPFTKDKPLKGEADDRINILLLGMGGKGHPGPYLTDTIMVVSLKPSNNQVSMVSIPRDLSVPIAGYGWKKINNANHYGEMKKPGEGGEFASQIIEEVVDLPIHYYVRVDFSGFEKLINELGGIKINVENSFVDSSFPTNDYGYQTVSFTKGVTKMDGETALNFARSRHGSNGESSDFARSKRQQKVLEAVKDKALSFTTFLSYKKLSALMDLYKENVSTNLKTWEIFKFVKLAKRIDKDNINNTVLDNGNKGPLYSTNINGAYILLPKDMSFYQVQQIVKHSFEPQKQEEIKEPIKIEIQNGTRVEGLAYKTSLEFKEYGYKVVKISNADEQNFKETIIYDFTNGEKQVEISRLKEKLNGRVTTKIPETLIHYSNIDFLIILGEDQDQTTLSKLD